MPPVDVTWARSRVQVSGRPWINLACVRGSRAGFDVGPAVRSGRAGCWDQTGLPRPAVSRPVSGALLEALLERFVCRV